jgi:hypothetical protein
MGPPLRDLTQEGEGTIIVGVGSPGFKVPS